MTTGAGDPGGRAVDLAAAARRALPESRVLLLQGPQMAVKAPPGVRCGAGAEPRRARRLCGGGGTLFEVCAAGVPAAVSVLAPNQAPIVETLARAGAVVRLDDAEHGAEATLRTLGGDRDRGSSRGRPGRRSTAAGPRGSPPRSSGYWARRPANR